MVSTVQASLQIYLRSFCFLLPFVISTSAAVLIKTVIGGSRYGFYGATLSSASAFEARMDALSRELGDRGRDHSSQVTANVDHIAGRLTGRDESSLTATEYPPELILELRQMKLLALQRRATAVGVPEDVMEDAMESADPRTSLIELIAKVEER